MSNKKNNNTKKNKISGDITSLPTDLKNSDLRSQQPLYLQEQNSHLGCIRNVNIKKDFGRFQQGFTIANKEILRHLHSSLTFCCSQNSPNDHSCRYNGIVLLRILRYISIYFFYFIHDLHVN